MQFHRVRLLKCKCVISHFLSHSSPPFDIFKACGMQEPHLQQKNPFKMLPCNGYTEPEDGDTGWETAQRPHTATAQVQKILKCQKSKCVKPVRSWRADAAPKAEFNPKKMLNKVNTPHLYL